MGTVSKTRSTLDMQEYCRRAAAQARELAAGAYTENLRVTFRDLARCWSLLGMAVEEATREGLLPRVQRTRRDQRWGKSSDKIKSRPRSGKKGTEATSPTTIKARKKSPPSFPAG